jgi:hypothetical protein
MLFYPEKNFLVNYYFPKMIDGQNFKGCIRDVNEFTVISWNSDQNISIYELIDDYKLGNLLGYDIFDQYYKPIEDVMTIEEFYSLYTSPENQDCVYVPMDLWEYK